MRFTEVIAGIWALFLDVESAFHSIWHQKFEVGDGRRFIITTTIDIFLPCGTYLLGVEYCWSTIVGIFFDHVGRVSWLHVQSGAIFLVYEQSYVSSFWYMLSIPRRFQYPEKNLCILAYAGR